MEMPNNLQNTNNPLNNSIPGTPIPSPDTNTSINSAQDPKVINIGKVKNPKEKAPIIATTQDHLDILDVRDDLLVLKTGTAAIILETTAVNFYLLSQIEQESKIIAFAGLLNSLNFFMQIVIHTEKVDIAKYVFLLEESLDKTEDQKKKHQIKLYLEFIKNLIQKNNVLDKRFYIVIPYTTSIDIRRTSFKIMIGKSDIKIDIDKTIENAKSQLYPKKDVIIKLLAEMGIKSRQMNSVEITKLFYTLYNKEHNILQNLNNINQG